LLQTIENVNEEGLVDENVNIVTADMESMYAKMPLELSKQGISEYFDTVDDDDNNDITKEEMLEALDICQEKNLFEFKDDLYKQKEGHATGQKQAPPVACSGAGLVEKIHLNTPRDIVFDDRSRILSKPIDDPVFYSVQDLTRFWGRFIDDVFNLFGGNYDLFPGQVKFSWEFSRDGGIFLNVQMYIDRENKRIETKYYVKPTNQRLYLHFKSNHPPHVFKSIVYSQALQGIMVNSKEEWNIEYLQELKEKFLDQGYPRRLIMEELIEKIYCSVQTKRRKEQ
jgi:hypothetical protein